MTGDFNADEFCKEMQEKAKGLNNKAQDFNKSLGQGKTHIKLTINGQTIEHDFPCNPYSTCETCLQIIEIQKKMDDMARDMNQWFKGFDNLFDNGFWF